MTQDMVNDLKPYINPKNPLVRYTLFLSLFGAIALIDLLVPTTNFEERMRYVGGFSLGALIGIVVFGMVRYGFRLQTANPLNFLISTSIVTLLIHPTDWIPYLPITILIIPIAKWLLRWKRTPLVNPAGGAILIITLLAIGAGYIFTDLEPPIISWWGTDMVQNMFKEVPLLNYIFAGVLILGFWYFAWKFKKLPYVVSFYAVFLGITFAWNIVNVSLERAISIAGMMMVNATAFFALVMLPEPKTSPIFPKGQIVIGALAGGLLFVANNWFGGLFIDPFLLTLLLANGVVRIIRR